MGFPKKVGQNHLNKSDPADIQVPAPEGAPASIQIKGILTARIHSYVSVEPAVSCRPPGLKGQLKFTLCIFIQDGLILKV